MTEFFSHPVPAVIFLLGILILVHELGHFIVGKLCGIGIDVFSIGFGPRLAGFSHHGTDYRLSWIPLGGYVKFVGGSAAEEVPDHLRGKEFYKAPVKIRIAIVAAGPLANLLLAVFAYMLLGYSGIPHPPPIIGQVIAGSPAELAEFKFNDRVKMIDGEVIETWYDLEKIIARSPGKKLKVIVLRDIAGKEQEVTLEVTPESVGALDMADRKVVRGRAGIALGRLPSTITVVKSFSVADQAGLKTGDQILEVQFNGASFGAVYFPELLNALFAAWRAEAEIASFKVKRFLDQDSDGIVVDSKKKQLSENRKFEEKLIAVPLRTAWTNIRTKQSSDETSGAGIQPSIKPIIQAEALVEALGISDSELTIEHIEKSVVGVLKRGDVITKWNKEPIKNIYQLMEIIRNNTTPKVKISLLRAMIADVPAYAAGHLEIKETELEVNLEGVETQRPSGKLTVYILPVTFLGQSIDPEPIIEKYNNPFSAFFYGVKQTTIETGSLLAAIWKLIIGEFPLKALGGPLLIAKVAGDSVRLGWQVFVNSLAMISLNLAILNLFPIPVLDGGQLVLFGVEIYRKRPLSMSSIESFQKVGFVMIMALIILATYNDISRFWKSILEGILGVFS